MYQEPNDALASLLQKFPEKSDEVKLALIEVLEREHSFQKNTTQSTEELASTLGLRAMVRDITQI